MVRIKPSVSRFEGDHPYPNKRQSFLQSAENGDNEFEIFPTSPLPPKAPFAQRATGITIQPNGHNKPFNSYFEGDSIAERIKLPSTTKQITAPPFFIDSSPPNPVAVISRQGYVAVVVSGIRFVSPRNPILSHAGTRLGQAVASAVMDGPPMLQMSGMDAASDIANMNAQPLAGDTTVLEFYCDRNAMIFPHILQYYRTGTLHLPHNLCWDFVKDELTFWGIDESAIPECCRNSFRIHERHLIYAHMLQGLFFAEKVDAKRMNYGMFKMGSLYRFLYEVETNWKSYFYFYFYTILALLFAVSFMLQLIAVFRVGHPPTQETNSTHCLRFESRSPHSNVKLYFLTHPHPALRWFDVICTIWFSLDLMMRFICYPSKVLFLCHAPNIIELICLAGNYFSNALLEISSGHFWCNVSLLKTYLAIEVLRVFRLCRIPFFSPRYSWMRVLLLTLKRGFGELLLLIALVFVFVMFYGYLIIIPEMWQATSLESGQKSVSANIYQPHLGMWWAIVTMATVGYGDYYPTSPMGYIIGSTCAITGVLFLSLQVPLISNRFNLLYQYAKQESNKLEELRKQKSDTRRRILEEERIRRERFWKKQFQQEENWEDAFRSGRVNEETITGEGDAVADEENLQQRKRSSSGGAVSNPVEPMMDQVVGYDDALSNVNGNNNREQRQKKRSTSTSNAAYRRSGTVK